PQNDAYTASQGAWNIEEVSLRSPDRNVINVSRIDEPLQSPLIWKAFDTYTASTVMPAVFELNAKQILSGTAKINVAAISEPEFPAWFQGTIAQIITPIFQRSDRTAEPFKITIFINQPDIDWDGFLNLPPT